MDARVYLKFYINDNKYIYYTLFMRTKHSNYESDETEKSRGVKAISQPFIGSAPPYLPPPKRDHGRCDVMD